MDPWGSVTDDIRRFFSGHTAALASIVAVWALCDGASLAVAASAARSTFICSAAHDSPRAVGAAQVAGVVLDAVAVVLAWRVLAWAKTTRARLSAVGSTMLATAAAVALASMGARALGAGSAAANDAVLLPSAPRYAWEVLVDGALAGVFAISTLLFLCETTPSTPASLVALLVGVPHAFANIGALGSWTHIRRLDALLPLYLTVAGFVTQLYVSGTRYIVFFRRGVLATWLILVTLVATLASFFHSEGVVTGAHPLSTMVYDARIAHDRWLRHAAMSMRPAVAADEYRRRSSGGRDPPPNFDKWFQFALARKSPVLDGFDQITADMEPFWGLDPAALRERVEWALAADGVAAITVRHHRVTHDAVPDAEGGQALARLAEMVQTFAGHLPDMVVPVNLGERPQVLAPWDEKRRLIQGARKHKPHKNLPAATLNPPEHHWRLASSADVVRAHVAACPPGALARAAARNPRDVCDACAGPNAPLFVADWAHARDTCAQPDLLRLHGLYAHHDHPAALPRRPFRTLVPLFSAAKTDAYSDVVIPFPRTSPDSPQGDPDGWKPFSSRRNSLFWRGVADPNDAGGAQLRGNHVHRLLHAVNNATEGEVATVLLPQSARSTNRFEFAPMTLRAASAALPFDVELAGYAPCVDGGRCDDAMREIGGALGSSSPNASLSVSSSSASPPPEMHTHRFILALDTASGPSAALVPALRSSSVPVVASLFTTWFSDRVAPWVHFVPLDLRLHGLHSTVAYFSGMRGEDATRREMVRKQRKKQRQEQRHSRHGGEDLEEDDDDDDDERDAGGSGSLGKNPRAVGNAADGAWIAGQGKAWADRALRWDDEAVYLFRVLLEWGRVVRDDRDEVGWR
jgi:hypothetical protein